MSRDSNVNDTNRWGGNHISNGIVIKVKHRPPLCRRTLGRKSRLLRDFSSFFDVDRSFACVVPDVVIVVPARLDVVHVVVVVVVVRVVAGVRGGVGAIGGERHRRRRVVDVRRSRMHRERRRLRSRGAADHRASRTDAPLGPR